MPVNVVFFEKFAQLYYKATPFIFWYGYHQIPTIYSVIIYAVQI